MPGRLGFDRRNPRIYHVKSCCKLLELLFDTFIMLSNSNNHCLELWNWSHQLLGPVWRAWSHFQHIVLDRLADQRWVFCRVSFLLWIVFEIDEEPRLHYSTFITLVSHGLPLPPVLTNELVSKELHCFNELNNTTAQNSVLQQQPSFSARTLGPSPQLGKYITICIKITCASKCAWRTFPRAARLDLFHVHSRTLQPKFLEIAGIEFVETRYTSGVGISTTSTVNSLERKLPDFKKIYRE